MTKIRILPEQLANQIAAGEVVERPASVVKELVENSIDAGAKRIEVEIEGSGTRLMRIIDNGEGMDEDDLLMSLERHGTSKIKIEADLSAIGTLGFRGEAIPSIGSVSQLSITSRPEKSELGTRVVFNYGKLLKVHDFGCGRGTTFEVRNLFGNTPARRKFLRTVRTELGHIDEIIRNYGLCSPDITFILRVNGKETLHLDSTLGIEQRLRTISNYQGPLLPLNLRQTTSGKHSVSGFLIPPEQGSPGPARLRLFVNGRAVRDRLMTHAICDGLRGFLMKGKNPSGLIHLLIPDEEVDVNVHPAKQEVRFRHSRDIHLFLSQAVTEAMTAYQTTLKARLFGKSQISEPSPIPIDRYTMENKREVPVSSPTVYPEQEETGDEKLELREPVVHQLDSESPMVKSVHAPLKQPLFENTNHISKHPVVEEAATKHYSPTEHNLIVVGQYDNLYIFCQSEEGLLVIDQHAAHERLLYEKLKKQFLANSIVRQNLMFPETVELSLFQSQLVEKNQKEIEKMGFSIREFGGNTYIISAVPALAGTTSPRDLFFDILEHFGSESNGNSGGFLDNILATMACKAAVKAGTTLSTIEIDKLLNDMVKADLFSHCPHGRPVVKIFPKGDIKKWFYRT